MSQRELKIVTSIKALLHEDVATRTIAERLGVSESQVRGWRDVFEAAGTMALLDFIDDDRPRRRAVHKSCVTTDDDGGDPTTDTPSTTTFAPTTPTPGPTFPSTTTDMPTSTTDFPTSTTDFPGMFHPTTGSP